MIVISHENKDYIYIESKKKWVDYKNKVFEDQNILNEKAISLGHPKYIFKVLELNNKDTLRHTRTYNYRNKSGFVKIGIKKGDDYEN